jgi:hypothetical protein
VFDLLYAHGISPYLKRFVVWIAGGRPSKPPDHCLHAIGAARVLAVRREGLTDQARLGCEIRGQLLPRFSDAPRRPPAPDDYTPGILRGSVTAPHRAVSAGDGVSFQLAPFCMAITVAHPAQQVIGAVPSPYVIDRVFHHVVPRLDDVTAARDLVQILLRQLGRLHFLLCVLLDLFDFLAFFAHGVSPF